MWQHAPLISDLLSRTTFPVAGSTVSWHGWAITSERPQGRRRRISSVLVERLVEEIEDAE